MFAYWFAADPYSGGIYSFVASYRVLGWVQKLRCIFPRRFKSMKDTLTTQQDFGSGERGNTIQDERAADGIMADVCSTRNLSWCWDQLYLCREMASPTWACFRPGSLPTVLLLCH